MNLNEKVKLELCKLGYEQTCCKVASLSAFVRTAGSIVAEDNKYGFSVSTSSACAEYYAEITEHLYGARPLFTIGGKSSITGFSVLDSDSLSILIDLGIIKIENNGITIAIEPDDYLVENECCKRAYVRGAFLGGGCLTVPDVKVKNGRTGYHLEFVFSKYLTAQHFSSLLVEVGFFPKLIERKGNFVVYFKQHEEIKDILVYMGATSAVFEFSDLVVMREVKNNTNRVTNCEISNVNKQVEASLKQCAAIKIIQDTIGLETLSPELEATAKARLKYSDYPLSDLADHLCVSKSCLNHRLRKLVAIADSIK